MGERCRITIVSLALLLLASCSGWWHIGQKQQQEKVSPKIPPPLYLGTVQQVYPAQKFVLLRIIGPMPSPGATLISHPADGSTSRIANLQVAEDSSPRNGILAADVRSGVVVAGDRVFLYRDISSAPSGNTARSADTETEDSPHYVPPTPPGVRTPIVAPDSPPSSETTETELITDAPAPEEPTPPQPSSQGSDAESPASLPDPPQEVPSYIKDIPDDVTGWN